MHIPKSTLHEPTIIIICPVCVGVSPDFNAHHPEHRKVMKPRFSKVSPTKVHVVLVGTDVTQGLDCMARD